MYRMPYHNKTHKNQYVVSDNTGVPALTILSAQPYAESPPQENLEVFKNSVVVIGGSYDYNNGSNDMHETPIGGMPGALVIINAIHSLLQGLTIKPVSYWWLVITFVIILTLFAVIPEPPNPEQPNQQYKKIIRWSLAVLILFIIVGLFVYSIILFEDGTWLDIAIPVAIIEIGRRIYQTKWLKNFFAKIIGTPAFEVPEKTN
jgi:CHASE2 domain-containing sensor protein